jgi:branched-chain amino acid transport system ATP-binding protein
VISSIYEPSSGRVLFKGEDITGGAPYATTERGVGRTFQTIRLFGGLSVLENVMIGAHCRTRAGVLGIALQTPKVRAEEVATREKALHRLEMVNLKDVAGEPAASLPPGQQRMVEIARALMTEPELLLLDEPTAGLTPSETDRIMSLVSDIRDRGTTVLLVEHKMRFVMGIADSITALNFGKKIAEGKPETVVNDEEVIRAYLGRGGQYASH